MLQLMDEMLEKLVYSLACTKVHTVTDVDLRSGVLYLAMLFFSDNMGVMLLSYHFPPRT